jgi:hypothetical protein
LVSLFALVRAPDFQGGRCGKEQPAEVGSGEPQDRSAGGGLLPFNCVASGDTIQSSHHLIISGQNNPFGRWLGNKAQWL